MNKRYKIKELCILKVYVVTKIDVIEIGIHDEYGYELPELIIAAKEKNNIYHDTYYDILTNTKIYIHAYRKGDLIVKDRFLITPFLTEKELLAGKICKKRLIEIYQQINQKEKSDTSVKKKIRK